MLSRVVDSLYWMSRYLERAEHTARLLDVHSNLMLDASSDAITQQRLARLQNNLALDDMDDGDIEAVLWDIAFSSDNHAGIIASISTARENARQVREQLSSEMWMQMNRLYLDVMNETAKSQWQNSPHDFYMDVRQGTHLFQGITDATMNHNQGWHFIQAGRYIERSLSLLQILESHFADTHHLQMDSERERYFELLGILKSVSAFEAYCKVYTPSLEPESIVEFLLLNESFPRSLRFCIDSLLHSLRAIATSTGKNQGSRLYRIAGRLQSNLSYDEIQDIDNLHGYLAQIQRQIYEIHDTLYSTYITYSIETAL